MSAPRTDRTKPTEQAPPVDAQANETFRIHDRQKESLKATIMFSRCHSRYLRMQLAGRREEVAGSQDVPSTRLRYSLVNRCCSQASPASRNSRSIRLADVVGAWARRAAIMSRISRSDFFSRS